MRMVKRFLPHSALTAYPEGSRFQSSGLLQGGRLSDKTVHPLAAYLGLLLILSTLAAVAAAGFHYAEEITLARDKLRQNPWGEVFFLSGLFFVLINGSILIWRIVLFRRYRPVEACADESLPRCTVIVPAYNEGRQVMGTLLSLARSDYPGEKLQLIAVDDGSVDDTWTWIMRAKRELKGRVQAIRLPKNQGKRHALYAGFKRSEGDVLVTVDSDSEVERDTLRKLVSPFVANEQVGAVAGNVRVLNGREGLIPRMLDVTFLYSFDFIRAGQSMVNTVMCTPGALSAYRRGIVEEVMEEWVRQTFFGRPANIGEDRAMTNLILRAGYHVHFQQDAYVYTQVPIRYKNLCKMFLRWARSNIRETFVMSRFAFRRFRKGPMLGARINLLAGWMSMCLGPVFWAVTFAHLLAAPSIYSFQILSGIVISTSLPAGLYCWRRGSLEGLWAYLYGIFWFLALSWITPYALLTPHKSGWLTRQLKQRNRPVRQRVAARAVDAIRPAPAATARFSPHAQPRL